MINATGRLASFWRFSITAGSLPSHYLAIGRWSLSVFTRHSPLTTGHLPSALPDSEFGNPEWVPICLRHILRKATFFGFFENLKNQVFDASY